MATGDLHAIVESLFFLPFPREDMRDGNRSSGPGYHMCVLRASQNFWDCRCEEVVEAAEAEIDADFQALVNGLTARWGRAEVINLRPFLWAEGPVLKPLDQLCQLSGEIFVWRRPEAGRWIGLTVGQADPEFPIELLAAVGKAPFP